MTKWCTTCDRPVQADECEVCGRTVLEPAREPIPLKWKFFLIVTVIYLIWRIYQLISWLSH